MVSKEMNIEAIEPYRHWGVCDTHCEEWFEHRDSERNVDYDRRYTEANVTILDRESCTKLADKSVNITTEFCAGRNTEVQVDVYKMKGMLYCKVKYRL